ncbi:chemotaxis protein CheB [Dyella sp. 2HG41-7]|uniref:chemotaxis protein CheB n=1 Tax=Dyella sp. 2HG41-7 TaxID=2883239 RepID=UPI001F47E679|nr:chemotaxis protein CheB [Dyella sp. 2HG41-7]
MSEQLIAVALLFDDAELGSHLRTALSEHGAKIVHEGPVSSFDETSLRQAGLNVLVVNLDDSVDDAALDRIYDLIGEGDISVVFNDAQASRALDGWDRARWARHLAAKALNHNSIDPPRPDNAKAVETPDVPLEDEPHAEPIMASDPAEEAAVANASVEGVEDQPAETSETLAAELEALLASQEATDHVEHEFGSGLKYRAEDELAPLHDGHFGEEERVEAAAVEEAAPVSPVEPVRAQTPEYDINLDHLSLASWDEDVTPPAIEKASLAQQTPGPSAPEWGFVEEEHLTSAPASTEKKSFGVEKVSAADYLAPNIEHEEGTPPPIELGMSLELVSIEEAIAPKQDYEAFETRLHELDTAFARLLVIGAARDSDASLASFLAALPGDFKLPILLTQHQGYGAAEQLVTSLTASCPLPVKVATAGMRARVGEVVVVPRGQQVRITRDGRVELNAANDDTNEHSPSIDTSFTMAANIFGRNALAIVFAGHATDAVAGAQAIHDRGGQVWVESSSNDHYADMVHGVMAERLASFSGSPQELAVRLMEDFQ